MAPIKADKNKPGAKWTTVLFGTSLSLFTVGVVVKLLYLAGEVYYNRALIEFVGKPHWSVAQAHHLEHVGHLLAAVGGTVLILSILGKAITRRVRNTGNRVVAVLALALFSGSLLYNAEGWLIHSLVEHSSAELRYNAYYLNLLRELLVRRNVLLNGVIPDRGRAPLRFSDKLVLAELPVATLDETKLVDRMKAKARPAVESTLRERAVRTRFEADWLRYHAADAKVMEAWKAYRTIVSKGRQAYANGTHTALSLYQHALVNTARKWPRYRLANEAYYSVLLPRISGGHMDYLIQQLRSINRDPIGHLIQYQKLMRLYFNEVPPFSFWRVHGQYLGAVNDIRSKARDLLRGKFENVTGGIEPGLTPETLFRSSSVRAHIAAAFRSKGIPLPMHYDLSFSVLNLAVHQAILTQTRNALQKHLGPGFPLGLDAKSFLSAPGLSRVAGFERSGPQRPITWMLDKAQFFKKVWAPLMGARISHELDIFMPNSPKAFDQAQYRAAGDEAVKLLFVIPVALLFSSVFALLNSAVLATNIVIGGFGLLFLVYQRLRRGVWLTAPEKRPPWNTGIGLSVGLALVAAPFLWPSPILNGRPEVKTYYAVAYERAPAVVGALNWLNHGERLVYSTGESIHDALPTNVVRHIDTWISH